MPEGRRRSAPGELNVPTPSKFTAARRHAVLEVLKAGGSRRTAASVAAIEHSTLLRWIERGRRGAPGGRWREFFEAVQEAEADPQLRALKLAYRETLDDPAAAWRFLERVEPGYAPTQAPSPPAASTVIQLTWPPPALPGGDNEDEDG